MDSVSNIGLVNLAFVGFGEASTAIVEGWGARDGATTAYDIKTDDPDRTTADAKFADYQSAGIDGKVRLPDALENAELVFSLVTADQAETAAEAAAPHVAWNALFLDGNSCAPGTKRRSAAIVEAAGGRYVDVAIMAPIRPALHKTPMLLSGPHAGAALDAMQRLDMNATIAEGEVGTASSIKMMRSVVIKGMEALVLECVLAARKAGVEDVVLDSLDKTYPGFDWRKRAAYMMERVTTHGVRRAAEMREVALTVDELGLEGGMSRATVDWQQRIGDLGLPPGEDDYKARADAILKVLIATEDE